MALLNVVDALRVLVVDDDPDIRALLVSILADDGYEAESAANGRDALALLERWRADLVVLDLMMPVMDGWALAARMREREPALPIVVVSAARDLIRHADTIGATDVIPKPFDIDTFLPTIQRAVGRNPGATPA